MGVAEGAGRLIDTSCAGVLNGLFEGEIERSVRAGGWDEGLRREGKMRLRGLCHGANR